MRHRGIRVHDVVYPRLRAPDLGRMERFLHDFGLARVARTDRALSVRGTGPQHHVHVTELGERPGLAGLAFAAAERADLERLARLPGASAVHARTEPGGGERVTLTDPDGFLVEVLHGFALHCDTAPPSLALNLGARIERRGSVKRTARGPARIRRLGHVGLNVPDVETTFAWYHHHLGFLESDAVVLGDIAFARFCRCDRGAGLTDHHTLLIAQAGPGGASLNHAAFEVCDLDDVWLGHEALARGGYRHHWGVGRHTLGSQIFDYWRDPWGHVHEHYTDGDLLDATHRAGAHGPAHAGSQWGPEMPPDFGQPEEPSWISD